VSLGILNEGTIVDLTALAGATLSDELTEGGRGNGGSRGDRGAPGVGGDGGGGIPGGAGGSGGSNGTSGGDADVVNLGDATGPGQIVDTIVYVHDTDTTVTEGGDVVFNINRTGVTTDNLTVEYEITGTAGAADFEAGAALSGSVNFTSGGSDLIRIVLPTLADTEIEGSESFSITLTSVLNNSASGNVAVLGTSSVDGAITNLGGFTDGADTILGTSGDDNLAAGGGDDLIRPMGGSDMIDGGEGIDTVVYEAQRGDLSFDLREDGTVAVTQGASEDILTSIERVELDDGSLLYGLPGVEVDFSYRLYSAAFARTPDEPGLRFWNDVRNDGLERKGIAEEFVDSLEFAQRYGADPTDEEYIDALYNNVLMRDADEPGRDFWLTAFDSGDLDRADMLLFFSESPENVMNTEPDIDDGLFVL